MKDRLISKLKAIRENPAGNAFVLADAKDADMAWGIASPGPHYPPRTDGRAMRSMPQFFEQIREIVGQGEVDILLASVWAMGRLAHEEHLFDDGDVTPAIRANDTTDVWVARGAKYRERASLPFATATINEAMYGTNEPPESAPPRVELGLYSMTFNNDLDSDLASLEAFKRFRHDAQRHGFHYFLEVFAPNVDSGIAAEDVPAFVNDSIVRALAGVPDAGRPQFLKIPFFGPKALEELVAYDPSMIVGVLGGSSGTTYDAFLLLEQAQKHGARVALFGRKIKDAEDPLTFIRLMRRIVDGDLGPREAVVAYHDALRKRDIPPRRPLKQDLETTSAELSYAR